MVLDNRDMQNGLHLKPLFDRFLFECQYSTGVASETIRGYRSAWQLLIKLVPEIETTGSLGEESLTMFFQRLHTRQRPVGTNGLAIGVKSSTTKTYWAKLNAFFKWLEIKGAITCNPLKTIRPPVPQYAHGRALSEEHIRRIYAAVILHSHTQLALRRDTAIISLLYFCGLRLGEFIDLEVTAIDFEKRIITVRGNTSKSKRTRFIPMHPTLQMHLRDYLAERNKHGHKNHYLIVSTKTEAQLTKHGLKHWVKAISEKSGVRFHLHQFRHSFACALAERDVNPIKIQKLLGHSSLEMTMTYLRSLGTDKMHEDIQKLSF